MRKIFRTLSIISLSTSFLCTDALSANLFGYFKNKFGRGNHGHQLRKQESTIIHNKDDKLGEKFNVMINGETIFINDIKTLNEIVEKTVQSIQNSGEINKVLMGKILYIKEAIKIASNPTSEEGWIFEELLFKITEISDLIRHGNVSKNGKKTLKNNISPLLDIIDSWEETGNLNYEVDSLRELLYIPTKH